MADIQQVQLFGIGTKSVSPAITAQKRINCRVEVRREQDKTSFALIGRQGMMPFVTSLGVSPTRGMWAVNSLTTPLGFFVQGGTVYSVNNSGVVSSIGSIGTNSGDVVMTDNGTFLMVVDGQKGYTYNMLAPAGLNLITDGNFTTTPKYCTFQDTYFIVVSGGSNQFQLSANGDPTTWPAVNINFTGFAASLQACVADHGILYLFGQDYTEFWQDAGSPGFPYAKIPGVANEYGLLSAASITKFDNSLVGLFINRVGQITVSRFNGFNLQPISDQDITAILEAAGHPADARAYATESSGHPLYVLNIPSAGICYQFDSFSNVWSELQDTNNANYWGDKSMFLVSNNIINDRRNANLYILSTTTLDDNGSTIPLEIWTKHIRNQDKYIGIPWVQIDIESGVGTATGGASNPVMDLQVSKDGGNTFTSVGFSSMGQIGEYTQRVRWQRLGGARDWILKLRITDSVKRVITGATAGMIGANF